MTLSSNQHGSSPIKFLLLDVAFQQFLKISHQQIKVHFSSHLHQEASMFVATLYRTLCHSTVPIFSLHCMSESLPQVLSLVWSWSVGCRRGVVLEGEGNGQGRWLSRGIITRRILRDWLFLLHYFSTSDTK